MGIILAGAGAYLDISGKGGFPTWLWIVLAISGFVIAQFLAFHKVRLERDRALEAEKPLIITPHKYAIGLSGMTEYPQEPEGRYWLCLEVAVAPNDKSIDKLDLLLGEETIPVNYWPGKNVATFNAYFDVTNWKGKGKAQVELVAYAGGKSYSSGRVTIDFDIEPGGIGHRI